MFVRFKKNADVVVIIVSRQPSPPREGVGGGEKQGVANTH